MILMLPDDDGNEAEVDNDDGGFSGLMLNFPFLPLFLQFSMNNVYMTTTEENVDDDDVDSNKQMVSLV